MKNVSTMITTSFIIPPILHGQGNKKLPNITAGKPLYMYAYIYEDNIKLVLREIVTGLG